MTITQIIEEALDQAPDPRHAPAYAVEAHGWQRVDFDGVAWDEFAKHGLYVSVPADDSLRHAGWLEVEGVLFHSETGRAIDTRSPHDREDLDELMGRLKAEVDASNRHDALAGERS